MIQVEFQEYQARKIVNVHKHVDGGWFWDKYSAHPYIGCRSGCEFCYLRGGYYHGAQDPQGFDSKIRVKMNAVELLQKELTRLQPDLIACGDWQQPTEDRYRLSRRMLEVALEIGFPVLIIERSPLITRDLDLLVEIGRKSWAGVTFSLSNVDPVLKHVFEPRSPGIKKRLQAMQTLAAAGIMVGASLMPILPFLGDDRHHLEEAIKAVKQHGGKFILAAGLSMDGAQAQRTLAAFKTLDPAMEPDVRQLYSWRGSNQPSYSPPQAYNRRLGLLVRELCVKHGLTDRMPRYIPPGDLGINRRIAEKLFLKTYDLELEGAASYRIWAYRKAAWGVDEYPESIARLYQAQGINSLLTFSVAVMENELCCMNYGWRREA
jgi:DNA repair photolyase